MKVCPVCNETFADELKFCDLDGTRLKREVGTTTPEKQNRTWSLIGVGLLVGALVISALSIIFLPKARVSPSVANSESGSATTATRSDSPQGQIAEATPADSQSPEIIVEEAPAAEVKKKDPAQANANGNVNGATPNPKAAAKEAGEDETAQQADQPAVLPPPPPDPEPAPAVKPASDTRESDAAAKSASSGSEVKKDQKKSKDDDDDKKSDKKGDEKKKKKGGGFFGAFKKIFGKD